MRSVRSPIVVPHPQSSALDWEYALRFRGPTAEVESFTVRGVQTVKLSAGNCHSGSEVRCVNRRRSYNYKVPHGRAGITFAMRDPACSRFSACSAVKLTDCRRCVSGQARKSAGFHWGPSFNAATKGDLSCQGAEAASERLGVRQSNYRFERSMMAFMESKAADGHYPLGAALRDWRSAQPGR